MCSLCVISYVQTTKTLVWGDSVKLVLCVEVEEKEDRKEREE